MKKNKFSRYFIFISIFTFFAVFGWIVQTSYNKLVSPILKVQSSKLMKPIDQNIDLQTLELIEKREELNFKPETILPVVSSESSKNE